MFEPENISNALQLVIELYVNESGGKFSKGNFNWDIKTKDMVSEGVKAK